MAGDLYVNTGVSITIRLNGHYYQRVVGRGWFGVEPEAVADLTFWPMHATQRDAYTEALRQAGLLGDAER